MVATEMVMENRWFGHGISFPRFRGNPADSSTLYSSLLKNVQNIMIKTCIDYNRYPNENKDVYNTN